jgi:hypothetical protein
VFYLRVGPRSALWVVFPLSNRALRGIWPEQVASVGKSRCAELTRWWFVYIFPLALCFVALSIFFLVISVSIVVMKVNSILPVSWNVVFIVLWFLICASVVFFYLSFEVYAVGRHDGAADRGASPATQLWMVAIPMISTHEIPGRTSKIICSPIMVSMTAWRFAIPCARMQQLPQFETRRTV